MVDKAPSGTNDRLKNFKDNFLARCKDNTTKRWIRFSAVAIIYTLWVVWLGNYWFLLGLPLLFDIYITGYIPFSWWRTSKSKMVRSVMSWVDAIVYALILVYFIFNFLGQNYMIPSSSLEKTLLTGDYLLVEKVTYGPRVPMTPVHFPLAHNTMPVIGGDSYADWPQNGYRRLSGTGQIERGDIVVFNFPYGDTIVSNEERLAAQGQVNVYYDIARDIERNGVAEDGAAFIKSNPEVFGEVRYRPVDRRTNYVKRCVGLPGDTFKVVHDTIYANGRALPTPVNSQQRQIVALSRPLTDDDRAKYRITNEDMAYSGFSPEETPHMQAYLRLPANTPIYKLPLSLATIEQMRADGLLISNLKYNDYLRRIGHPDLFRGIFNPRPLWTPSDWGGDGVVIPFRGLTIPLTEDNWTLYERCIRNYEGHNDYYFTDGKVLDGQGNEVKEYTFAMDYYMMMGDNRDNSSDSRFWGFVPEDHIVGRPLIVLISFDPDKGLFSNIRWSRMFSNPNPDKAAFKAFEKGID
ncbi:MAG: signal peptidase I [Muribaculaceae bacterium]|nr:signal peptidase I [Muribaculaceae bacterium]